MNVTKVLVDCYAMQLHKLVIGIRAGKFHIIEF